MTPPPGSPSLVPAVAQSRPRRISGDKGTTFQTLRNLWPYMWPAERPDLKRRVVVALLMLVIAKIITVLVPYTYKWATDALVHPVPGTTVPDGFAVLLVVPVMLVVAYGAGRILLNLFNQLRDALFAKVGQHAVRRLAFRTFVHMHELALRYHLQRRTGGLARVISRGTNGIESIVRFTILNTIPTIFEFVLSAAVITYQFDWIYLVVVAVTVVAYVWFTVKASDWRIHIRRAMNDSDTDANSKAIDSLLNYETVKYFGNEADGGRALRPVAGALRAGRDPHLDVAGLDEHRAGRHLHHRHDDLHGALGGRGDARPANHRRFRAHQRADDEPVDPAELHRLRLSRDKAGAGGHRGDVRSPRRSRRRLSTSQTRRR